MHRMESFAHFIKDEIGYKLPAGAQLQDITALSYRYAMYKVRSEVVKVLNKINSAKLLLLRQVGPVLSVSHGMGMPSLGILLHEMIKLMHHAKCKDPVFIRLGTCGGVGIEGGTVVVSNGAVDGLLRDAHVSVSLQHLLWFSELS